MKFAVYIMSLIIIVLTIRPCIDKSDCNLRNQTNLSTQSHDHHSGGQEHCSPFCACMCCATPVVYKLIHTEINIHCTVIKLFSFYKSEFHSDLLNSIWQPPRLA